MERFTSAEIRDFVSKANFDEKIILGKDPSWPKISIVTPSYNQGQFLERTILSVLNQGYSNLEYLILDGGSSDGSVEIIRRYADKLTYWKSFPDKGQSAAIADGFALASGDIIGWLNSDDLLMPNALINVAKAFLTLPEACAVTGRCAIIDARGRPFGVSIPVLKSWRSMLYFGTGFLQMATFWKKSAYEAVGQLNAEMYFSFDADLFVRLRQYGKFEVIPSYLAAYRCHGATKTSNSSGVMHAENGAILRRYDDAGGFIIELSHIAKRLRPVQRIRDKLFWFKDKSIVSKLCASAGTERS